MLQANEEGVEQSGLMPAHSSRASFSAWKTVQMAEGTQTFVKKLVKFKHVSPENNAENNGGSKPIFYLSKNGEEF